MLVGQTNRRAFIAGLGGAAAWPLVARAQQPMPVMGFLTRRLVRRLPAMGNAFVKACKRPAMCRAKTLRSNTAGPRVKVTGCRRW